DFPLTISATAPPGAYWLQLGGYLGNDQRRLTRPGGQTEARLGPVVVLPPARPSGPVSGRLANGVELLQPSITRQGSSVEVRLRWLPTRPIGHDYSVFVHLLDSSGKLVAQADGPPDAGLWPSRYWQPGAAVPDLHRLVLPPALPPGRYRLAVGFYQLEGGRRLAATPAGPEPDSLAAGALTVP
ncbi:MAG: hypothetical protein ACYDAG_02105, partial [Chloroflexota bacterium]